jgi:hypothetical protein
MSTGNSNPLYKPRQWPISHLTLFYTVILLNNTFIIEKSKTVCKMSQPSLGKNYLNKYDSLPDELIGVPGVKKSVYCGLASTKMNLYSTVPRKGVDQPLLVVFADLARHHFNTLTGAGRHAHTWTSFSSCRGACFTTIFQPCSIRETVAVVTSAHHSRWVS